MAPDVILKLGDTLIADCTYRDSAGNPVNLDTAGITIKSHIRSADGMVTYELEYIPRDQITRTGEYRLRGESGDWKVGDLKWDIRYFRGEDSFSSRTLSVRLLDAITPA